MSHTYVNCLIHVVFSTRNRQPLINASWKNDVHAMMGGIARDRGFPAMIVGGVSDHVHALVSLSSSMSLSEAIRILKLTSSKWINDTYFSDRSFTWQHGYGAFSVGLSSRDATVASIRNQEAHHQQLSFQDEFRYFLSRHGIAWDEKYIWG